MKNKWNYIEAIIFFIGAIITIVKPNLLIMVFNKLGLTSIILIFMGVFLIFYKYILEIVEKIYKKLSIRIVLSFMCIILVILKMFNSELEIDNTSIYLVIISIAIIVIPDLNKVIERVTKVKTGEVELEFTIKSLSEEVEKVEQEVDKTNDRIRYDGIDKETSDRFELISSEPKLLIVAIGMEIEIRLRKILNETYGDSYSKSSIERMLREIPRTGILNDNQIGVYREFRYIRNKIAHGDDKDINEEKLYEFADLGLRVLKTIPTEIKEN